MKKIRDLRLLIGAAALAVAGTSAGFAIAAATTSSVQADPICEQATVNGRTLLNFCPDFGTGNKCVSTGVSPQLALEACVPF